MRHDEEPNNGEPNNGEPNNDGESNDPWALYYHQCDDIWVGQSLAAEYDARARDIAHEDMMRINDR